jgi:hypothetical protein
MNRSVAMSAVAAVSLAGCGELFGDLVQQPPAAVTNMLYNIPPDKNLMRMPEYFPGAHMMVKTTKEGVVWTYVRGGVNVCQFTARVKEETATSAVVWTESEDISDDGETFLCNAVRIAGEESVAATLEGRPVDRSRLDAELAAAAVKNFGSIQKTLAEEIVKNAPQSKECWQETDPKRRDGCRRREYDSDYRKQERAAGRE